MKSNFLAQWSGLAVVSLASAAAAHAAAIIAPGDIIRAFDSDVGAGTSSYPGGEGPGFALDSNSGTKYLNFGGSGSGIIVTPSGGASQAQSFQITTGNDAEGRDPTSWLLYGTNSSIVSADNSNGAGGEAWSFVANGSLTLPSARQVNGSVVNFANANSYTSYKMIFPTLKSDTIMQVADIKLFNGASGAGTNVFANGSPALAIDAPGSASNYPTNEAPALAIDGNTSNKYLNFGKVNSGIIVQPAFGSSVVSGLEVWTANDAESRDPATYSLYGANGVLASLDNSFGDFESWTLISSGSLSLPSARNTSGGVIPIPGSSPYTLYKFQVTGIKNASATDADSTQYSEFQLYGTAVPEPTGASLLGLGLLGLLGRRARKR